MDSDIAKLICIDQLAISKISGRQAIGELLKLKHKQNVPVEYEAIFDSCRRIEKKIFERIKFQLKDTNPTLCCDEWTSRSRKRFLNIQAYWQGKKYSLGLVRVEERCTGNYLALLIKEHLEKYSIESKFMCTDGALNMEKCTSECGFVQLKFFLHAFNLAIKDTMYCLIANETIVDNGSVDEESHEANEYLELNEAYIDIVSKVRSILKFFARSPAANDLLKKISEEMTLKYVSLNVDCVTR